MYDSQNGTGKVPFFIGEIPLDLQESTHKR